MRIDGVAQRQITAALFAAFQSLKVYETVYG